MKNKIDMETKELLASLAKLESTLQDVESAKNQVKQTVDAYDVLQKQIKEYTQSLESIKNSIHGILSDLQTRRSELESDASGILSSFEAASGQLLANLSESTSGILEELKTKLSKANEVFAKESNDISIGFKNNTEEQLTKLQQSVLALKECTTALEGLQTSVKDTLAEITQMKQGIAELKQSLESSQGVQDALLSEIKSSIGSLTDSFSSFKTSQDNAFKKVDSQFKANSDLLNSLTKELYKSHRFNIVISTISLVLLFVLITLMFLK